MTPKLFDINSQPITDYGSFAAKTVKTFHQWEKHTWRCQRELGFQCGLKQTVVGSGTTQQTVQSRSLAAHQRSWLRSTSALAIVIVLVAVGVMWPSRRKQPHIVFILADDLGWNDVSYHGSHQIRTPNIDALAWNGVRFDRLYYQPLCSPSRAALMTGRYPIHTGMQHHIILQNEPRGLPLHLKLLPEWLNGLGYSSYMVGKWHLGFHKTEYTPTRRGFSSHVGSWGGFVDYYSHDRRVPMFLYVAHLAPHFATERERLQVPEMYLRGYDGIGHVNRTLYAGMVSALDESVGDIFKALHEEGMLEDSMLVFTSDNGACSTSFGLDAASPWPLKGEKATLWEGGIRVPGLVWTSEPLWRGPGSVYERFFHVTDWLPTLYEMAGGSAGDLGDVDGVSHLHSFRYPASQAPRNELLVNINPILNNSAIIQGRYKLVIGASVNGQSDHWIQTAGSQYPDGNSASRAMDACRNSVVVRVLHSRGDLSPVCGEPTKPLPEGVHYSAPVDCRRRNVKLDARCDSEAAPCLFDVVEDPCEYNNIANEMPEVVQRLLERLDHYEDTAVPPGNQEPDELANPALHSNVWVSWRDE
ncbi:arylsulfatase B-like isoform X2 [Dermacentor silvarum]|uniref:arylsulfatase B-like isoform X2 n=1 Tax=Dermacentor silvarum TaxID=543639 RepID=UPI00210177AA|nr:arylsulfatase B-like isoform X2 [Dermacentor silvarum]